MLKERLWSRNPRLAFAQDFVLPCGMNQLPPRAVIVPSQTVIGSDKTKIDPSSMKAREADGDHNLATVFR